MSERCLGGAGRIHASAASVGLLALLSSSAIRASVLLLRGMVMEGSPNLAPGAVLAGGETANVCRKFFERDI